MHLKSSGSHHTDPLRVNQVKNRIHQQRNHLIRGGVDYSAVFRGDKI